MHAPTLLLDMDGVVADFVAGVSRLFGISYREIQERESYDLPGIMGISDDEFWRRITAAGENFWSDLPPYSWNDRLLDVVHYRFGENVCLLTDPGRSPYAMAGKAQWIKRHLPDFAHRVFFGRPKHLLAGPGRVLLDDYEVNCENFEQAGGAAWLFPAPWNRNRYVDVTAFLTEMEIGLPVADRELQPVEV